MMEIAPGIWRLDASGYAHVYVVDADELVLIDSGFSWNGRPIWRELQKQEKTNIKGILLTHHDADHAGGAAYLQAKTGAPVFVGEADIPFFHGMPKEPRTKTWTGKLTGMRCPQVLQALPEGTLHGLEVLPAPGHTPGHSIFRFGDALFCGDLFSSSHGQLTNLSRYHADGRRNAASLKAAMKMDFRVWCPAHGGPIENTLLTRAALQALIETAGSPDPKWKGRR